MECLLQRLWACFDKFTAMRQWLIYNESCGSMVTSNVEECPKKRRKNLENIQMSITLKNEERNSPTCTWGSSEDKQWHFEAFEGGYLAKTASSVEYEELVSSWRQYARNNMVLLTLPSYSSVLAPTDFCLFLKMKMPLKGHHFNKVLAIKSES